MLSKWLLILLTSLFMVGCGGGGSSDSAESTQNNVPVPADQDSSDNSDQNDDSNADEGSSDGNDESGDDSADEQTPDENTDDEIEDSEPVEPLPDVEENSKRIVGESFNLSDQLDISVDSFSSNDSSIASIDESGSVSVHKAGFTEITATNSTTSETTTFPVFAKDAEFNFTAWVGETDSQLGFNDSLAGLSFIRSTEENCQPIPLVDCGIYEIDTLDTDTIVDSIATLGSPGFYNFTFGQNTAATSMLSAERFEVRSGEATAIFNNKLYLIGGYTTGDVNNPREFKSDVWISKDGDEWLEVNESAEFSPRSGHQLIVHDDKLWLIGGSAGSDIYSDVWVSENGSSWTQVTQESGFAMRTHFEVFSLNGELFIAGGYTTHGEHLSDMWHSSDARNWTQVEGFNLAEASNSPIVVLEESGTETAYLLGDKSYRSTDGLTWSEVDEAPIFTGFDNKEASILNNEIWLFTYSFENFGSRGYKNISRIFKSTDGTNWTTVKGGIYLGNLIAREAKPIPFNSRIYIVGGRAEILEYTNEVWSTTDGKLWVEHTLGGFYGPRHSHAMVSHNGQLISTGGVASETISTAAPYQSDVWGSEDGVTWNLIQESHGTFRARAGHQLVSIDDMLCYTGGYGRTVFGTASGYRHPFTVMDPDPAGSVLHVILFEAYGVFADIACSSDGGEIWSEVVPTTDDYFDGREGFAAVNFNGELLIIGGNLNANFYGDVWSTGNIEDWDARPDLGTYGAYLTEFSKLVEEASFGARTGHAVTVHNGELFLSGGKNAEGFYLDDLWKSTDGTTWTLVNSDMGEMDKRAYHQMVSFNDKLWIIAGRANYHETLVYEDTTVYEANDIWVSEDNGINWELVAEHAPFEQRQNFQAVVHNDALFVTGGTGGEGYVTVQGKDSILNDVWRTEDGINWRAGFHKTLELSTTQPTATNE